MHTLHLHIDPSHIHYHLLSPKLWCLGAGHVPLDVRGRVVAVGVGAEFRQLRHHECGRSRETS